jgi:hypothetical protein
MPTGGGAGGPGNAALIRLRYHGAMEWGTVTSTIEDLRRRGFTDHFKVSGRTLLALDAGKSFLPRDLVIRDYYRFEGVSDPDDMAVVYAIEEQGGTRGILTDAYGAYADPAVGAMLDTLRIDREIVGR